MRTAPELYEVAAPDANEPMLERDARMPRFHAVPDRVRALMHESRVVVVGAGALGTRIVLDLARVGVRAITIVDPDELTVSSLSTHCSMPQDVGRPKAEWVGAGAKRIDPRTSVRVFVGRVEDLGLGVFASADAILLATDRISAEVAVARVAGRLGKRIIQAAVMAELLVAQVRNVSHATEDGPCLCCAYGIAEWDEFANTTWACDGTGNALDDGAPTRSTAHLCAIAASLALHELLRVTLQIGPGEDATLEFAGYTNRTTTSPLRRAENCRLEHRAWVVGAAPRALHACTPRELLDVAGIGPSIERVSIEVERVEWVACGMCRCSSHRPVERFWPLDRVGASCVECGEPVRAHPFSYRETAADLFGEALHRPLGELGAPADSAVMVRDGTRTVLFCSER
ncbi:MAG: ThiF family adenylyltransferase [Planctomycetota bacterium]|jgi:molybdopterin/thiamine biosynthesis adenylyltransferase